MSPICKVCQSAGKPCNHQTRGDYFPQLESEVFLNGWPVVYSLGKTTDCPYIRCMVCPNKNCFNGKDGKIRYPEFAHTPGYCPCAWNINKESENKNNELAIPLFKSELNKLDLYDELESARDDHFIDLMDDWVTTFELEEQEQMLNDMEGEELQFWKEKLDTINNEIDNGKHLNDLEFKNYLETHKKWRSLVT